MPPTSTSGYRVPVRRQGRHRQDQRRLGQTWTEKLHRRPQNYVVAPEQPWLDGYCVEKGVIRQFVAMPLGAGYTAEEQLTGEAEHGGLQIMVYPMKRKVFEERFPKQPRRIEAELDIVCCPDRTRHGPRPRRPHAPGDLRRPLRGLGLGPRAHQPLLRAHRQLPGLAGHHRRAPPTVPPTAAEYSQPRSALVRVLRRLRQGHLGLQGPEGPEVRRPVGPGEGRRPLPENESTEPDNVVQLRKGLAPGQVREGAF